MTLIAAINKVTAEIYVSGIKRVYSMAEIAKGVSRPDLPAIVPVIKSGTYNRNSYGATGSYLDEHTVTFRLLERPAQTGINGEALAAVAGYLHSIRQALVTVDAAESSINIEPVNYEAGVVDWYGSSYYGADIKVQFLVGD
jgi:hypothetical protein